MDALVSTGWLADHLHDPDLLVFDATKYLPTDGKDGLTEFGRAHIPGAGFFDIDAIADPDTKLPHMVPTPGRFEQLLGALGVSSSSHVVFYDQKGIASAPRGWWMMTLFGHDATAVLDGGLPKWLREGRPAEAGPPAALPPAIFQATLRATRLRGIGDMMQLDPGTVVLDARPAGRFDGTAPEPRPGLPSGHMPGSRSLPFTALLNPDGTMLDPDHLRSLLAGAGADGSRPVVTSCGTGVTATILTLALHRAGLPVGAVYDGSWTEWASRPDTPKETT
jgi:thiosulfate/3-mercaptopyruvate sulfurtransferase